MLEFTTQQLPNGQAALRDPESARRACEDWYERNAAEAVEAGSGVSCSVCIQHEPGGALFGRYAQKEYGIQKIRCSDHQWSRRWLSLE